MKKHILFLLGIITVLAFDGVAYAAHITASEYTKCGSRISDATCGYFKATLVNSFGGSDTFSSLYPYYTSEETCCGKTSGNTCDNQGCWVSGFGICIANGTSHDTYSSCDDVCGDMGYDAMVTKNNFDGTYYVGCACAYATEWRTYKTGVLRRYTRENQGDILGCVDVALDEYKCAAGYYGPNNNANGCQACPANATCSGGTTFFCKDGYYKNSEANACLRCPDSKEGGLGWDKNGNGVPAINGEQLTWCSIESGTVLYDVSGMFIVDPNYDYSEGCEYIK